MGSGASHRPAVPTLNFVQFLEALRLLAEDMVGHPQVRLNNSDSMQADVSVWAKSMAVRHGYRWGCGLERQGRLSGVYMGLLAEDTLGRPQVRLRPFKLQNYCCAKG